MPGDPSFPARQKPVLRVRDPSATPATAGVVSPSSSTSSQSSAHGPAVLPGINSQNLRERQGSMRGLNAFNQDGGDQLAARPSFRAKSVASVMQAVKARPPGAQVQPSISNLSDEEPYSGLPASQGLAPFPDDPDPREQENVLESKNETRPNYYETKHEGEASEAACGTPSGLKSWQQRTGKSLRPSPRNPLQRSDTQSRTSSESIGSKERFDPAYENRIANARKNSVVSDPYALTPSSQNGLRPPPLMARSYSAATPSGFGVGNPRRPPQPEIPDQLEWSIAQNGVQAPHSIVGEFDNWLKIPKAREVVIDVMNKGYLTNDLAFLDQCDAYLRAPPEQRYQLLQLIIRDHLSDQAVAEITIHGHELRPLRKALKAAVVDQKVKFDDDLSKEFRMVRNKLAEMVHSLVVRNPQGAGVLVREIAQKHESEKATAARKAMLAEFQAKQDAKPKDL